MFDHFGQGKLLTCRRYLALSQLKVNQFQTQEGNQETEIRKIYIQKLRTVVLVKQML